MIIGILKEPAGERRVSMLPEMVTALGKMHVQVLVEQGAGAGAYASDEKYTEAGASIGSHADVLQKADLLLRISPLEPAELAGIAQGKVLLNVFQPLSNRPMVEALREAGITSFSLDIIPRTTRAQSMDILSSTATVSGYKAVLAAANLLPKFFPMFMTAAGSITPAKVLILGAGVAGLQAIATARRLGAVVEAFDVRAAAKEEVLSLGAKFVEVEGAIDDRSAGGYAVEQSEAFKEKQMALIQQHCKQSDVVISTAQIPGRKAPLLITEESVKAMKPGSVIVDLAASSGGNCALTQNDQTVECHGVRILGQSNLASDMPMDASKMFGKNVLNLLKLMVDAEGNLQLNFEDDIILGTCVTHQNELMSDRVKAAYADPA